MSEHGEDHCLEDVFLGAGWLSLLDEGLSFFYFIVLQLVDYEVVFSLRKRIDERRQYLQGILSITEHYQIVSKDSVVVVDISALVSVLQDPQLGLCCFAVLQQLLVASLEVETQDRVGVVRQLGLQDL